MTGKHAVLGMAMALMMSVPAFPVHAEFVKDSYIVKFKEPAKNELPVIDPPNEMNRGTGQVPFGEHSTGQSREKLAAELNLKGGYQVVSIYETVNAVHLNITEDEAHKLSLDDRVLYVEQDQTAKLAQSSPGWALDRLDEVTPCLDNTFNETQFMGAGRTIYILDSGLALNNPTVAAEFEGRASVIWDASGGSGYDYLGHGTQVAVAAAGKTYGVARDATVIIAKITTWDGFEVGPRITNSILAFNWLAQHAPAGTIVNWSNGLWHDDFSCSSPIYNLTLEASIRAAHNAGIIVVVAAANDGCNTADFSPTRIPEAFVVGATNQNRILSYGQDQKALFSRTGWNISAFAPGEGVLTLDKNGEQIIVPGTSMSAAYVSGLFATACQAAGTFCDTATSAAPVYEAMRNTGTVGTVVTESGSSLPFFLGATSRFIPKQW